jgi:hypothetical protein
MIKYVNDLGDTILTEEQTHVIDGYRPFDYDHTSLYLNYVHILLKDSIIELNELEAANETEQIPRTPLQLFLDKHLLKSLQALWVVLKNDKMVTGARPAQKLDLVDKICKEFMKKKAEENTQTRISDDNVIVFFEDYCKEKNFQLVKSSRGKSDISEKYSSVLATAPTPEQSIRMLTTAK